MNKEIEDLEYEDLLHFIFEYNFYIKEFPESHDTGSYPVCIREFYQNKYQEILKEEAWEPEANNSF